MCNLVNSDKFHNCFACNLADSIDCLHELLNCLTNNTDTYHIYRLFLPQIYLIVEEIDKLITHSDYLTNEKRGQPNNNCTN